MARSRRFDTELAGLEITDLGAGPNRSAPLFTAGGLTWGFTPLPHGDARPPQWVPYLPVADVDETAARAVRLA